MTSISRILALIPLLLAAAVAQDGPATQKLQVVLSELHDNLKEAKVLAIGGAVMGPTVKNAPYSAVEVNESTQMLADGNRIHQESQTTVYRDSEGRVRRETPDVVTIWDPVANTSYLLNPKTQTARRMPLAKEAGLSVAGVVPGGDRVVTYSSTGSMPGMPAPGMVTARTAHRMGSVGMKLQIADGAPPKSESLGKQTIEGVEAEGTRFTSTLEAGAIGNDRPIQTTSETWYSPDLQTTVKSVHSDPRMGEETFRLTNISRVEPPSTLFQVPAEYQVVNPK